MNKLLILLFISQNVFSMLLLKDISLLSKAKNKTQRSCTTLYKKKYTNNFTSYDQKKYLRNIIELKNAYSQCEYRTCDDIFFEGRKEIIRELIPLVYEYNKNESTSPENVPSDVFKETEINYIDLSVYEHNEPELKQIISLHTTIKTINNELSYKLNGPFKNNICPCIPKLNKKEENLSKKLDQLIKEYNNNNHKSYILYKGCLYIDDESFPESVIHKLMLKKKW